MKTLILILLLAVRAMAQTADTTYVYQIENTVWDLMNDPTHHFWNDTLMQRQIELSLRTYAITGYIWDFDTVVTSFGISEYALRANFISIRGVAKISEGREHSLAYRALRSGDPNLKNLGGDAESPALEYFSITKKTPGLYYLILDPPSKEFNQDTVMVHYSRQCNSITSDSTILVIPYGAFPQIVYQTAANCALGNHDLELYQMFMQLFQMTAGANAQTLNGDKSEPQYIPPREGK